jgi:hypothetical protein
MSDESEDEEDKDAELHKAYLIKEQTQTTN